MTPLPAIRRILSAVLLALMLAVPALAAGQTPNGGDDLSDEAWEDDDWSDWDEGTWDPWEPWNRRVFAFNEAADRWVLKPTAEAYRDYVPGGARRSVRNFFNNLGEPFDAGTNYLRGRGEAGTRNVLRFFMNTTFGVFGLFDVASAAGLEREPSDFGLTFGTWGAPEGPYVVLPLLGPSNVRDTTGLGAQYATRRIHSPYHWADAGTAVRYTSPVIQGIDTRASLLSLDELIEQTGSDRYIFMRESYLQNRRERLGQDDDDWDDWDEEWDGDEDWEDDEWDDDDWENGGQD